MSEEETTKAPEHSGMSKEEVKELLAAHRREMMDEFHEERQRLLEELADTDSDDKAEREEIKQRLAEHDEYVKQQLAAQKQKEETKGDKHTIVVPPSSIPGPTPQNHSPAKPPKKGWKKIW